MCRVGVSANVEIGTDTFIAPKEEMTQMPDLFGLEGAVCLPSQQESQDHFRDFRALAAEREELAQVGEKRLMVTESGRIEGETVADTVHRLNREEAGSQFVPPQAQAQDPLHDNTIAAQDFSKYSKTLQDLPVGCTLITPNGTSWVKDQNGNLLFHTKNRRDGLWSSMNTTTGQPTSDIYQMTQPGEFVQLQQFQNKPEPAQKPQSGQSLKIDLQKLSGPSLSETMATINKNKERI
jgi:hypothetical protein